MRDRGELKRLLSSAFEVVQLNTALVLAQHRRKRLRNSDLPPAAVLSPRAQDDERNRAQERGQAPGPARRADSASCALIEYASAQIVSARA